MFKLFKLISNCFFNEETININPANGLPMVNEIQDISGCLYGEDSTFSTQGFTSNSLYD